MQVLLFPAALVVLIPTRYHPLALLPPPTTPATTTHGTQFHGRVIDGLTFSFRL